MAPFMDREKVTKPTAQIGFIKFVLIPMFETVMKVSVGDDDDDDAFSDTGENVDVETGGERDNGDTFDEGDSRVILVQIWPLKSMMVMS